MKKLGSYYTPEPLIDFALSRIEKSFGNRKLHILEPGCGDGRFITRIHSKGIIGEPYSTLIEIDDTSYADAKNNLANLNHTRVVQQDFLFYESPENKKFDLIIGNPPYISKKLLSSDQIQQIQKILTGAGVSSRADKNIWPAFVVKSVGLLKENGQICFILPFDLLQVKYGEDVQRLLEKEFNQIEIYNIKGRIFEASQNTVLLIASKHSSRKGIFYSEVTTEDINSSSRDFDSVIPSTPPLAANGHMKWRSMILSAEELRFINGLAKNIKPVSDYITSKPGLVTAANSFFIVNEETLEKFNLSRYAKPIIQKSSFVNGEASMSAESYQKILDAQKPCFFLDFSNYTKGQNELADQYLELGEGQNIHSRYKCLKRKIWFKVPIVEPGEAVIFKRCHLYPKLLGNKNFYTTDSAYNISPKNGVCMNSFIQSFYNPLTLCFAELQGRHYEGGVLEMTPNEFRMLPLPYLKFSKSDYADFLIRFSRKKSVFDSISDTSVRQNFKHLGINKQQFDELNRIYRKLVKLRISDACL